MIVTTRPQPTFWKASSGGVKSIAAGANDTYPAPPNDQERRQFVIANLDTVNTLYVTLGPSLVLFPVRKLETITFECGQDVYVYNGSGSTVLYTFAELIASGRGERA